MGFQVTTTDGICHLVMDHPPVNALTVAGWFELADLLTAAGRDPEVGVVILSAAGKGFNAGVDIKEMQNTEGFDALIGANRGCAAAFGAIYDCEVPVICVVHDFVLGGGIGLMGNSDIVVAAEGTTIGLPEVKRGLFAAGGGTALATRIPLAIALELTLTGDLIDAGRAAALGLVNQVVPPDEVLDTALALAGRVAATSDRRA